LPACGIVSGIVLTFELGLNWGNYSRAVGPILGPMICMEALTAFFLEAGFIGILLYGEGRVSRRVTMVSTCMVALGALLSTAWILDANSWMQTPSGYREVNGQFQPVNWLHAIFNPAFNWRFPHMVLAVLVAAAWFIAAIGAYYLLRRRALPLARKTLSIGLVAAAVLLPIQLNVGDNMASYMTLVYQPDKLIAAEGNFNNGNTGWVWFAIPDQAQQRNYVQLSLPHAESVFVFHNFSGDESVPGLKTIPQNLQPTVAPVFWGFRLMIYGAWAMLAVAFVGVIMRLRRRLYTERPTLAVPRPEQKREEAECKDADTELSLSPLRLLPLSALAFLSWSLVLSTSVTPPLSLRAHSMLLPIACIHLAASTGWFAFMYHFCG